MTRIAWRRLLVDVSLWLPAIVMAIWLRLDFSSVELPLGNPWFGLIILGMILLQAGTGIWLGGYDRVYMSPLGRMSAFTMGVSVAVASLVGFLAVLLLYPNAGMPRSVPLIAGPLVICGALLVRAAELLLAMRRSGGRTPVIIYGSSPWGRRLLSELVENPESRYSVRAVLDEDPVRAGGFLHGVRIAGGLDKLAEVRDRTDAEALIIADSGLNQMTMTRIRRAARDVGIRLLAVPPIDSLGGLNVGDFEMVDLSDLMGREQVRLDEDAIAHLISGRRVLVTGAGGSIGSELCRQVAKYGPAKLVMLDRDEGGLHHTQLSLMGEALLDDDRIVLADLRDADGMRGVFVRERPQLVFHAAALKHQPLLERFPREAWMTNVLGSETVLRASEAVGADVVVNISTDKAANPTCVLGDSKRIAERLTAARAGTVPGKWVSVRFGNVLGSRGSVVETFLGQIKRGAELTITDRRVRRYFMTIPEAAQLVLQAAVVGESGETLVLDMGEPMLIEDLARGLMAVSGRNDLRIRYTGLRPGEKLSEELFDDREQITRADRHPMLSEVRVEPLERLPEAHGDWGPLMERLARPGGRKRKSGLVGARDYELAGGTTEGEDR